MKLRNGILAGLLAALTVLSGPASLVARAQVDPNPRPGREAGGFAEKADKLLARIHHAASEAATAPTRAEREAATAELNKLSRLSSISRGPRGEVSVGLLARLRGEDASEVKAAGFAVGAVIGDVATVEAEALSLPRLAALGSVVKLSAATLYHPVNDRARRSVGIDNSAAQRVVGQTGAGVVVGVIDSGIDFRHRDFTRPGSNGTQTRIKYLLDMTTYGGSKAGWDYTLPGGSAPIGKLYTEAQINAALAAPKPSDQASDPVRQRDKSGHGTHVAGTAAGNGLGAPSAPGTYAGMAPEADLIIVKANRQDTSTVTFRTDDTMNGLEFIKVKSTELNEPFVINMSLGGHAGPHDGTTSEERAIDNLVASAPGRVVCVAAGNEGADDAHVRATLPAGGTLTIKLNAFEPDFVDLYYKNSDRFTVKLTKPDGTTFGPVSFSANGFGNGSGQASDASFRLWNALDDKGDDIPSNDQPDIFLLFRDEAPGGTWQLTVQDADSNPNSELEAWIAGGFETPSNFTKFTGCTDGANPVNCIDNGSHLVASPGTSNGAITVGAFITRTGNPNLTVGNFAPFTSPGPTADGRPKPDISAPGYYLYSSRSSDNPLPADPNDDIFTYGLGSNALAGGIERTAYGGLAGTSMATPVVTGSVALLLQHNRGLTAAQVRELLKNTAAHDSFTGTGWTPHFGFGKLNIAAAISAAGGSTATNPIDDPSFFVAQHYRDFLGREADQSGLNFWTGQMTNCGNPNLEICRINVSAAFFLSIEFQQTGYLVERMYKAAYGDFTEPSTGFVVPVIRREEFVQDTPLLSAGVVVGPDEAWKTQLENNKVAYAQAFVQRPRFTSIYGSLTPTQFVDRLNTNAGGVLSAPERDRLIQEAGPGSVAARASVLRQVAEHPELERREKNRAFVLMQYFGYLRRNPNDAPEEKRDFSGYNFWLTKLNEFGGDFQKAQMVRAFLVSTEYRARFGTP